MALMVVIFDMVHLMSINYACIEGTEIFLMQLHKPYANGKLLINCVYIYIYIYIYKLKNPRRASVRAETRTYGLWI